MQQEISRRTRSALPRDVNQLHLALLRKWFWARKPDAGFLLSGFPATLLHARVFDEWLDAREEALTGCLCVDPGPGASASDPESAANRPVIEYYRTLGFLVDPSLSALILI